MAGIGKTAFAVHAAHQLADHFPDGQIFLRLHAHTPGQRPVDPAEALGTLLLATGVAPWHIPPGLEARSASWRSHLAGKRMLLVLDDAAGSDQVQPLLPGTPDCLVIVTSRRRLTALEAIPISLDMLPPAEAAHLFVRSARRPGLRPDDSAVAETVRLCGYLPLAIRLAAARLEHHPARTVSDLAHEIASARDEPTAMQAEDISVAAAFDLSYQDLTPGQQRMFRRLGLHPGTDIDVRAAAALDDAELTQARRDVEALYDQNLLTEPAHGRYRMHDLIRNHARSLAAADPAAEREAAVDRLLEYYLRCVRAASSQLERRVPARPPLTIDTSARAYTRPASGGGRASLAGQRTPEPARGSQLRRAAWPSPLRCRDRSRHAQLPAETAGTGTRRLPCTRPRSAQHIRLMTGPPRRAPSPTSATCSTSPETIAQATATLSRALKLYRELSPGYPARASQRPDQPGSAAEPHRRHPRSSGPPGAGAEPVPRARHRLGEATALNRLGVLQTLTGPYPESPSPIIIKALDLYRSLGNALGQAQAMSNLGRLQLLTGDWAAAAANLARHWNSSRRLGNIVGESNTLTTLGALQTMTGDYQAAFASLVHALEGNRRLRGRLGEARVLTQLGTLQRMTGDHQAASASVARAIELYRELGYPLGEAEALNTAGELSLASASPFRGASQLRKSPQDRRSHAKPA